MKIRPFRTPTRSMSSWLLAPALILGGAGAMLGGVPAAASPPDTTSTPTCPTYNPPSTLSARRRHAPEREARHRRSQTDLQVALSNPNGCPITTPLAGHRRHVRGSREAARAATFSASGSNAVLVGTDASGTAPASDVHRQHAAPAGISSPPPRPYGSVIFSLVNTRERSARDDRAALIAECSRPPLRPRYTAPLRVRVLDADDNPVAGGDRHVCSWRRVGRHCRWGLRCRRKLQRRRRAGSRANGRRRSTPRRRGFVAGTVAGTFTGHGHRRQRR